MAGGTGRAGERDVGSQLREGARAKLRSAGQHGEVKQVGTPGWDIHDIHGGGGGGAII